MRGSGRMNDTDRDLPHADDEPVLSRFWTRQRSVRGRITRGNRWHLMQESRDDQVSAEKSRRIEVLCERCERGLPLFGDE